MTQPFTAIMVIQQQRSFTDMAQRWAFTKLSAGGWQISNTASGFCFDLATASGVTYVVHNPCTECVPSLDSDRHNERLLHDCKNSTGLLMDVFQSSTLRRNVLDLSAVVRDSNARPTVAVAAAFFRG